MRTSVNISFFVSAESAASTASKKDYRSTAYNNYCIKSAAPRHCSSKLDSVFGLHDCCDEPSAPQESAPKKKATRKSAKKESK